MTTEERALAIILRLHVKTTADEVRWEETARDGVFQAALPHYIVKLWQNGSEFAIDIVDDFGKVLESFEASELERAFRESLDYVPLTAYSKMSELYLMARRKALGVNTALDSLLDELQ